jgi:cytochrome c553
MRIRTPREGAVPLFLKKGVRPLFVTAIVLLLSHGVQLQAQDKAASDLYLDKCAVCHGDDGAGKTAKGKKLKVKDVREMVGKLTAEQMADVVSKGKDPDMAPFAKELTPDQIRLVVAHYRDFAKKK